MKRTLPALPARPASTTPCPCHRVHRAGGRTAAWHLSVATALGLLLSCALAPSFPGTANAATDGITQFDYRLQPRVVADGVYAFIGANEDFSSKNGGNIVNTGFIVGANGVIVIDTGPSRRYGEQMLAAIRRITPLPVVLTINTHHHPDHFLGNQAFPADTLAALPATIAAIRDDGELLNENMYRLNGDWMRGTLVVAPTIALTAARRDIAGRDIELLAFDGHTAADLVLLDHATGTVFAGDLLFHDRAPTTPHADPVRWQAALQQLATLAGRSVRHWIPGHGEPLADDAALRQTGDYLGWLQHTLAHGADTGRDMAEMLGEPVPARFSRLAEVETEYRRALMQLYPAIEQRALEPADAR